MYCGKGIASGLVLLLLFLPVTSTIALNTSPCDHYVTTLSALEATFPSSLLTTPPSPDVVADFVFPPDYFKHLMDYSVCVQLELHDIPKTFTILSKVISLNPRFAFPYVNLGNLYLNSGDPASAISYYEQYFQGVGSPFEELVPTFDITAVNFGSPCSHKNHIYASDCIIALNNHAAALSTLKEYERASESLEMAIRLSNDATNLDHVYINLAEIYEYAGRVDDAAWAFAKSFEYKFLEWRKMDGGTSESSAQFEGSEAYAIDPSPLMRRAILLPSIPQSVEKVRINRILFERRVKQMIHLSRFGGREGFVDDSFLFHNLTETTFTPDNIRLIPPLRGGVKNHVLGLQTPQFFLHYNGGFDRPLQELVGEMHRELGRGVDVVANWLESEKAAIGGSNDAGMNNVEKLVNESVDKHKKKRIVFISSMFPKGEPHGLLLIDLIHRLPQSHFDVFLVSIGSRQPDPSIVASVIETYTVGFNYHAARQILFDLSPDCLIFAEMQNEAMAHVLGLGRFSPLQILVMGSPVTSGNRDTVDFFISADRLEHPFRTRDERGMEHYSEQVVLFDGGGVTYPGEEIIEKEEEAVDLAEGWPSLFQLPNDFASEAVNIYACPQNLFKIHPLFDSVIEGILHVDPDAHIVLQAVPNETKLKLFSDRLLRTFSDHACNHTSPSTTPCLKAIEMHSRVHFTPRVSKPLFRFLIRQSSCVLHPFPFGGSKTSSDTLVMGTPLVTFPQPYLRGRMAASYYETMGIDERYECCVANSVADYVAKAVRLGVDKEYRRRVSEQIKSRALRIVDDRQVNYEWLRFLFRAMAIKGVSENDLRVFAGWEGEGRGDWQTEERDAIIMNELQRRWKSRQ